MVVPLLDLKHPQPNSDLDLALPLSVLYGCSTIPIGGHIFINAQLRLGSCTQQERKRSVVLQVAKDAYNLHISVSDKHHRLFADEEKYYCIIGGKNADDSPSDDDNEVENKDTTEDVENISPSAECPKQESPDIHEKKSKNDKKRGWKRKAEGSVEDTRKPVVVLERLKASLYRDSVPQRNDGSKEQSEVNETPQTGRRFPARRNRMSKLIGMTQEYDMQGTPKIKQEKVDEQEEIGNRESDDHRVVSPPKKSQRAQGRIKKNKDVAKNRGTEEVKSEVKKMNSKKTSEMSADSLLPSMIPSEGQLLGTGEKDGDGGKEPLLDEVDGTGPNGPNDDVGVEAPEEIEATQDPIADVGNMPQVNVEALESSDLPPVDSDVVPEAQVSSIPDGVGTLEESHVDVAALAMQLHQELGEVSGEDASFIENLIEHNYINKNDEVEDGVGVASDKDPVLEDLTHESHAEPAEEQKVPAEAQKNEVKPKARKSMPKVKKTTQKEIKKDDVTEGYFIQVDGQLYFVKGEQKSVVKPISAKEVEDDSVYPFSVAGIEIPKGFRQKTFSIEQRKAISKELEPEKSRGMICPMCKLCFTQKASTHLKIFHGDENDPRNSLRCCQLMSKVEEVIKRFADKGTELDVLCPFCGEDFSSFQVLDHFVSVHTDRLESTDLIDREAVCTMVRNHVKEEWTEPAHIAKLRRAVGSHFAICPLCNKPQGKRSIFYHINNFCPSNALKEDHFQCKECMHISITEDEFKAHHERYHSKKFVCQFCATVFERKQMFYQHLRLVHKHGKSIPKEPVRCPVEGCKYKTYHPNRMKVHHERKHLTEKAHLCEHCGQSFKCKPYLITHYLQVHPDLKRYFCRRCKRGFRVHEAYKRHETCCFDLADPSSQIDFKATDNTPLAPEDCPELDLKAKAPIKVEPDGVPAGHEGEQYVQYILQEEGGGERVIGAWTEVEGDVLAQVEPVAYLPEAAEQELVSETMIVDQEGSESVDIDSQELLKLCGNEIGEFPPGTEILVYMDNSKEGEAPKIHVVQQ